MQELSFKNKLNKILENISIYNKYLWLLPILYGIIFVAIYGVNVIFWDEWDLVRLYDYFEQNGWFNISSIKMLFSQHNEHRILFPRLIMLISHKLTHFNVKICMFITQMMVIAVYGTCIRYFKKQREICTGSSDDFVMILFVLLSGIACFSSTQYENFLWGFQVTFYMGIFAAVMSIYYFYTYILYNSEKYVILSLVFGFIASFSCLQGLAVWLVIIILAIICLISGNKSIIKKIIPYILIGLVCFFLYFYKWKLPAYRPITKMFLLLTEFFLSSLGSMYTGVYSRLTVLFGGITVLFSGILLLLIFNRKLIKETLFPVGLIGFSYAGLFLISVGRAGLGIGWSNASRYRSLSILSYIGIVMIIYQLFILKNKNEKIITFAKIKITGRVFVLIMAVLTILLLLGNFKGLSMSKVNSNYIKEKMGIIQNYENQPIEKIKLWDTMNTYEDAYTLITKLKKYKLNVFSNVNSSYSEIPNIRLNGLKRIELNQYVGIQQHSFLWDNNFVYTGDAWAIDYISQKEYTQIYMNVNNKLYRTADQLFSPDVAKAFKNNHYKNVRLSFSFSISNLNIGENLFSAIVILNDGLSYYETVLIKIYKDENGGISFERNQ